MSAAGIGCWGYAENDYCCLHIVLYTTGTAAGCYWHGMLAAACTLGWLLLARCTGDCLHGVLAAACTVYWRLLARCTGGCLACQLQPPSPSHPSKGISTPNAAYIKNIENYKISYTIKDAIGYSIAHPICC